MRIVVVIWDGLRPDFVRPDLTPGLAGLAARGVIFDAHRAVFPSETRVNSSSLATGCRPAAHGITGNSVFVPEAQPDQALNTGDHEALLAIRMAKGKVLGRPTLASRIRAAGRRTLVVGAGSPGSTMLQDPEEGGRIINTRGVVFPEADRAAIETRYGVLAETADPGRWQDTALAIFEEGARRRSFDFGLLWLCDPDFTQHKAGLGAPENLAAIRRNDARLSALLTALGEDAVVFVGSDHGFSSLSAPADSAQVLADAGLSRGDVVPVAGGFHLKNPGGEPALVRSLLERVWVGPVFARRPCPGAFGLDEAGLDHPAAPDVVFSREWTAADNAFGVAGTAFGSSGVASHGTCGRSDMHAVLIGAGPSLGRGVRSRVPSGICDVAPTILALAGLRGAAEMDGRVLTEAFPDGPGPAGMNVRFEERTAGGRWIRMAEVEKCRYLMEGARS